MTTSEQIGELATALAKAQGEMEGASKDTKNPFFNHNYADLASVKDAIREPFAKHGLSIVQFPVTTFSGTPESYEWTAKRSGEVRYGVRVFCQVSVVTRLLHSSGQWIQGDAVAAMLPNGDPQSVGSAITYLRRYAMQTAAGVATEDDDGEAAQGRGTQSKPAAVVTVPDGYEAWVADLQKGVATGITALKEAWNVAPLVYRQHITQTDGKRWEGMKAAAQAVTDLANAKTKIGPQKVSA